MSTSIRLHLAILAALATIVLPGAAAARTGAEPAPALVTLKPAVVVESRHITVGDLFDGTGEVARKVVAFAPRPGATATLDVYFLYRVAKAYNLPWRPRTKFDQVEVRRASQTVGADQIIDAVEAALEAEGAPPEAEMTVDNRNLSVEVAAGTLPRVLVPQVHYDTRLQRFAALVEIHTEDGTAPHEVRIQGRVFDTTEIPVLRDSVKPGEVIAERNIEWRATRANMVRRDTVTDPADLIGMESRRVLKQGEPVRLSDLRRPVMVEKGALITVTIDNPFMRLTTKAVALDKGAIGDVIEVKNVSSDKVFNAVVNGTDRAEVASRINDRVALN